MTHTKMIDELETAIIKNDLSFYYTVCEKIKTALTEEQFLKEIGKNNGEKTRYQTAKKYLLQSKGVPVYCGATWNYSVWQVFTDARTFYMLYKPIDNLPILEPEQSHPDDKAIERLFLNPSPGERKEQKITEEQVKRIIAAGKIYKKQEELELGKNLILFDNTVYNMEYLSTALLILGSERATIETFHPQYMLKVSNSYGMAFISSINYTQEEIEALNKNKINDLEVI